MVFNTVYRSKHNGFLRNPRSLHDHQNPNPKLLQPPTPNSIYPWLPQQPLGVVTHSWMPLRGYKVQKNERFIISRLIYLYIILNFNLW